MMNEYLYDIIWTTESLITIVLKIFIIILIRKCINKTNNANYGGKNQWKQLHKVK